MSTTGIVVTGFLIAIALYDMVVVIRKGVGCSVSRFIQRVGFKSPIVIFVTGALCGHFWLYLPPETPEVTDQDVEIYIREKAHSVNEEGGLKIEPYTDPIGSSSAVKMKKPNDHKK